MRESLTRLPLEFGPRRAKSKSLVTMAAASKRKPAAPLAPPASLYLVPTIRIGSPTATAG